MRRKNKYVADRKLPVIWRVSYPKLLYASLSQKTDFTQCTRCYTTINDFFNFPIQVDFANEFENVLEKRQQFLIRIFFLEFSLVVRCFSLLQAANQRATLNHELTIVRVPEPRCQADENRLSSSAACKNDNTWASQPSSQRAAKAAVRRPSLLPSLSPSLSPPPSQSLPRSPLRQPMKSTAAVAATTS